MLYRKRAEVEETRKKEDDRHKQEVEVRQQEVFLTQILAVESEDTSDLSDMMLVSNKKWVI